MGEVPTRPKTIPAKAVWVAEEREWELGTCDGRGLRQGSFRFWRRDGSLSQEAAFQDGRLNGPFKRYHNNGQVSRQGEHVDGELHGRCVGYACAMPTEEPPPVEGSSPLVRRWELDYDHGRILSARYFDAEGGRVQPDGERYPERPPMVPDEAEFQPEVGWFVVTLDSKGRRQGSWQCWNNEGDLVATTEYVDGLQHGASTTYHAGGRKASEGSFDQGKHEGPWRFWNEAGELVREVSWQGGAKHGLATDREVSGRYQNAAIVAERGSFENDRACGVWELLDAQGSTVLELDLGPCLDDAALARSPSLANEGRPAEAWYFLSQEFLEQRRPSEALLAAARAAGASGSVKRLLEVHSSVCLPRSGESAAQLAESALSQEAPLGLLLSLLLQGAAPGAVLRALALRLDQQGGSRAALDLVNAAVLLEPEESSHLFTRALVLLSLGLPQLAADDARERESLDEGGFLELCARVLYPQFDFWPGREEPRTDYDGLPKGPAQPLEAVRTVFFKYVGRLKALREAQLAWLQPGASPGWLLPDLFDLLSEGPVALDCYSFDLEVGGGETARVTVDERIALAGLGLPALMRLARAEWMAMTWLCWACGLREVALPEELAPPLDFGKAVGMAVQRLWRSRDRRLTGGAMARRGKALGFEWEGVHIDALDSTLLSMPENEYAEMAAMLRWLTDAQSRSPWQDNLRDS